MTINEPSLDVNKDDSTLAWEKSVTEATNRMQHQIDNINESVNVPQNLIAVYSKTQDGAVQQLTPFADGDGFVAYVAYTDTIPTLPVTGATFSAYSDEEIDVIIKQYREVAARPTNPGTTSYQVSGAVWSSSAGWTKTKLNRAGINIWFSEARIKGQAGQTVTAKWSNAKLLYGGAVANGILYYNAASTGAPSAPTATGYDYDSGVFTGLTSGWQYVPITSAMGGGTTISHKHWQVTFHVETSEVTNGQIITFGTVEGFIPIGSDLQSDTYSAGSAGWKIERASGNAEFNNVTARGVLDASSITTGTLDCSGITVSNLNAGSITAGNLSATRISGGTLTVGNVTVSGAFEAVNLVNGIVISAHGGSGGGNIISFTSANLTGVNTDAVILVGTVASAPSSGQTASANTRFEFASNNGATSPNINSGAATSHGFGGVVGMAGGKVQLNKNTAYQVRVFGSVNQDHGGSFSGSCMVLEIKR